jgi:hypothetical protein
MKATYPLVKPGEFPFGFRCMECKREMLVGDPYHEVLEGFTGDSEVILLLCVYCDGEEIKDGLDSTRCGARSN